ncbi:uncharacterized protein LOC110684929 [Chenopodium quinoa]|uniref:uncharacterized protein LOC110684929 n=1 Tax=Chenopodium quinoa TaxID=63459 RepID=UPI000B7855A5|nr:uncharacterized protein LOC110684929 [Chenopodium quinoa]
MAKKLMPGQSVRTHVIEMIYLFNQMDVLGKPFDDDSEHDIILLSLHDGFDIVRLTHTDEGSTVTLVYLLLNHAEEYLKRRQSKCFYCGDWLRHTLGCPHYTPVKTEGKELLDVFVVEINLTSSSTWVFDTGCGALIVNNVQGLRGSKKLEKGEVMLRVGNGAKVTALAIGSYHLRLPTGLILVLSNCYYVPTITKNIISVPVLIMKFRYVYLMNQKLEAFEKFKEFQNQLTPPGTPQLNWVSERRNRTLLDMVRSMMSFTDLHISFWGYALGAAVNTLN